MDILDFIFDILDLFRPKWKSHKTYVRMSALENTKRQSVIEEMAMFDYSYEIRRKAVKRVTDQEVLGKIAKKDEAPEVRKAAIGNLTDQEILTEMAKNDTEYYVRKAAVKKVTDQEVLGEIAKNDKAPDVRKAAIENLSDQEILAKIANSDRSYLMRIAAVLKLDDQKVLVEIAKNAKRSDVRKAAMIKLDDQKLLTEIAKSDEDKDVREAAVKKLQELGVRLESLPERKRDAGGGAAHPFEDVSPEKIRFIFVVVEGDSLRRLTARILPTEYDALAVSLANKLWNEAAIRGCDKLVSLAGTKNVTKKSALDCIKRNFPTVKDCEYFLVKEGRLADGGNAVLVLALSGPP